MERPPRFLPSARAVEIVADGRIGISRAQHLPWRFTVRDSRFVSVKPASVSAPKSAKTGPIT
jgi:3-methyladenine DNA glycosylase Mpg